MPKRLSLLLILVLLLTASACRPVRDPQAYQVIAHPDGSLYAGDQVSFEIVAGSDVTERQTEIRVAFGDQVLGTNPVGAYGIGQRRQATFWWVWDTRPLDPGRYTLTFTSLPEGSSWTESFTLRSPERMPESQRNATWASTTSACCDLYYITGTDAERDLALLSRLADEAAAFAAAQLGAGPGERVPVYLMPRVIGHGGFSWGGLYVSYLDGNYVGNQMEILLKHEFSHHYDTLLGGEYLPPLFQEGLAVYLSGGHFKPEPIPQRAAALLDLGWYIPLPELAADFYNQQHDIGYLEAGALVQYLVESYGWGAFNEFYRTIDLPSDELPAQAIDSALQANFGLTLSGLESAYLAYLDTQRVEADVVTDLRLTVALYDTVRRYQSALDPSAFYLTAWLPDGTQMRQRGILADLVRHPERPVNRLLETLLRQAGDQLFAGDYPRAEKTLLWTNRLLDILES
jgi:hypothetical protein